jgi:hypothetical protein
MKRNRFFPAALVLVFLTTFSLAAQQGNEREQTIEDIFLQSIEMRILNELARGTDRDTKMEALNSLEAMLDDGRIQEGDQEVHYILDSLSLEGTGTQYREGGRLVNNFPDVRRRAAELMGKMGGVNAKDSLINVLLADDEPMVKAEAAYALGELGYNENDQVSQALSWAILNDNILTPDNNFAFATLLAFEKIIDSNGELSDASVFRALVRISSGNYIRPVKQKAQEVIKKLQRL